ncbi:MAG: exodeoxyribonuclease VII small subunit [Planctomycetota bacterium]|nr:exodeoxyribonuclease VII small subunit [Planctomycetota bacterium]
MPPNSQARARPGASEDQGLPSGTDAELSFEAALDAIEDLITRIESGEIGLEESIVAYERGVALVKRCRDALQKAELKVETLNKELAAAADTEAQGSDRPIDR